MCATLNSKQDSREKTDTKTTNDSSNYNNTESWCESLDGATCREHQCPKEEGALPTDDVSYATCRNGCNYTIIRRISQTKIAYIDVLNAPTSSTATILPTSKAFGAPKNLIKWGDVIKPLITLYKSKLER